MEKKRLDGITILGYLALLIGIGGIVSPVFHPLLARIPFHGSLLGIFSCLCAYGTLRLKNWGRILLIINSLLYFFMTPLYFLTTDNSVTNWFFQRLLMQLFRVETLVNIINIVYLARPKVKALFSARG